ncbi:hypothetical protein HY772_04330 [Candidatus Woesearchaeota archaeon]|nr:hypothetical protein [Candidatus Woesearchaeota archaeon]
MPRTGAKRLGAPIWQRNRFAVYAVKPDLKKSITFAIEIGVGRSPDGSALVLMSFQFAYRAMSGFIIRMSG